MKLIYSDKVKTNSAVFIAKVISICDKLSINPNWLMYVMYKESGLDHTAVNTVSGATGLIQFMPATAAGLATSTTYLRSMSNVDQLEYVYRYLKPYAGKMNSVTDVYLAVFFPAAMNKSLDYVFETKNLSASKIAKDNAVFDLNKDGKITRAEVETHVLAGVPSDYLSEMITPVKNMNNNTSIKWIMIALGVISIAISIYQIYDNLKTK